MKYVEIEFDEFDWDDGNILKIQKRVQIEEVEIFFKQRLLIMEDERHSSFEDRFIAMGPSKDKRVLFVAYTIRKKEKGNLIRVISARYTHKKEKEAYEKIKKIFIQE